jgi:nucleotide-binding universal stress UspA family protein
MSFKTILVHADDNPRCKLRLDVAIRVALDFGAELAGIYLVRTAELTPSVAMLLPAEVVEWRLRETGDAQVQAETLFRQATSAAGLTAIDWRAPAGDPVGAAVAHARCADLAIVGQPDPEGSDFGFLEQFAQTVVLSAGRPMLIIPYVAPVTAPGQRVLIAWDGGREAARAVGDALPILARARHVTVMAVHSGTDGRIADAAATSRLEAYLHAHGIDARIDHSNVADTSIGESLLSRTADLGIDLIVMGAYAHTRLRELILGGVTRTMLRSMAVPVLMSH